MMRIFQAQPEEIDAQRAGLLELLTDAVRQGASLGFLHPLTVSQADAYWDEVQGAMQGGARLLWIAKSAHKVVGAVQLDLCLQQNGANRAEVQKLLVHGVVQRCGVARSLMRAVEDKARFLERGLLFLDTEAGSTAELFYQACGYSHAGGLPDYACSPDGAWKPNSFYYKTLFARSAT